MLTGIGMCQLTTATDAANSDTIQPTRNRQPTFLDIRS
jgi:hypothetical protein